MSQKLQKGTVERRKRKSQTSPWHEVVLTYLGPICVYCGSIDSLHIHHITPLNRGGRNEMGNLEVVCDPCHKKIHKAWSMMPLKNRVVTCQDCEGIFEVRRGKKRCPRCYATWALRRKHEKNVSKT